ncbi:MAG: type II secretion system F family protein [Kiritimatiellae bacterium]|nr:type II secretion system F family protein [Kiritimatiellia bacterium]
MAIADWGAVAMTAAWGLFAAFLAAYVAGVASEVTYVTLADGRRQERSIPLVFKLLLPFAGNFAGVSRRPSLAAHRASLDGALVAAGFEGLLSADEFIALEILSPLVLGISWATLILVLGFAIPDYPFVTLRSPLVVFGFALFALQPALWLRSELRRRHAAIAKALPFVLDMLTLSVEAGLDFISALQRNCSARKMDPLNEELLRMTKEIQLGLPRREALKRMASRSREPNLRSVANALVQADELGVSIGSMLRIQADQMRSQRFARAERLANEAPVKMLFPLMVFIFPAVFIVILGPVLSQALKDFAF